MAFGFVHCRLRCYIFYYILVCGQVCFLFGSLIFNAYVFYYSLLGLRIQISGCVNFCETGQRLIVGGHLSVV